MTRRFPCGDTEKLKHSIRIFFLMRDLSLSLANEVENQLPLTKQEALVKDNDALDLSMYKNNTIARRRGPLNFFISLEA